MACVALTSLMATIELEFLQPIPRVSLHDEAAIKSFFEKLSSLQAFLNEANDRGAAIKDLETKIRDFALEAEDDIEIQLSNFLMANDTVCQEIASQELHQTLREAAKNVAELLKIINNTNNEADEANETQPLIRWLKHASNPRNVKSGGSSQHSSELDEDKMVGRHDDLRVIKDQLFNDHNDETRVISIVGMAGIGKTTLARSLFEDPLVALCFEVRGWITMRQEYKESLILSDVLRSITPTEPNEIKMGSTPDELAGQIHRCLEGRRYLIVLDNLWHNRVWYDIRRCFPRNRNRSCILLTTSHFDRHCYYKASWSYIHNMTLLDPSESWELFCNILSFKEYMAPKFEKIRSHVVEKCEGLPLAIVVVAERLSKCNNIQQEWKKIEKELESQGALGRSALTLSYNQMPQHLKVCFLYLVVFPKRIEILVKMLIRLWIAEGFVKLENQAYGYLQDLIGRSLVLIGSQSSDGKIKTCRIHSAVHSFCLREAQKEGILCVVNTRQLPGGSLNAFANSCRWLSLYTHSLDYYVLFSTNNPRSIFFFHENPEMFAPVKLLRVLVFVPSAFLQRLPMHLGDVVFLRYLSITQWFEGLDYIVSTNPNLQTLVVSGDELQPEAPTLDLPSRIWESPQLKHLELGKSYTVDPPSVDKENLQTLSWVVNPTHCRKEVYHRFPNIKKLKIFYNDDDIECSCTLGSCSNPIILDNLDYLVRLEKLTILVSIGCAVTLPEWYKFPLQLKKLRLSRISLSERNLTVIGMLPQLRVLKLENVFHEKVWKVVERGFRRLRFLLLEAKNLEQLMADKYSFQWLERLVLRFCCCLEKIPRHFAFIPTLQSMELDRCCPSIVASAKQIREERLAFLKETIEIKIHWSEYDESQYTHIKESVEDDLEESVEDDSAGVKVN